MDSSENQVASSPLSVTAGLGVRERTNRRNRYGVKAACDCYRTIKGHEYQAWMSCPSADRIAAYRAAGVRVRRFGEELFVHVWDTEEAAKVDQQLDSPNTKFRDAAQGADTQGGDSPRSL